MPLGLYLHLKCIDNFFIHLPDQTWTEQDFMNLTGYLGVLHSSSSCQQAVEDTFTVRDMSYAEWGILCMRQHQLAWNISPYFLHFPAYLAFPSWHCPFWA